MNRKMRELAAASLARSRAAIAARRDIRPVIETTGPVPRRFRQAIDNSTPELSAHSQTYIAIVREAGLHEWDREDLREIWHEFQEVE